MKKRVGEILLNNKGSPFKIIEVKNNHNILVQFQDEGKAIMRAQKHNILSGEVKNPFLPLIYGVGYLGESGSYPHNTTKLTKERKQAYGVWKGIVERCYAENFHEYNSPVYQECYMVKEWHNFTIYEAWHLKNYVTGFEVDKDIVVKGNKEYGPENCRFVPAHINTLLFTNQDRKETDLPMGVIQVHNKYRARLSKQGKRTNVGYFSTPEAAHSAYMVARKGYIKEVADEWKDKIKPDVYQSLISWEFE
jgi:hypothetical protein